MDNNPNGYAGQESGTQAVKDAVATQASGAVDTVRQQASAAADQAKDKVLKVADEKKQTLVEQGHSATDTVDHLADQLEKDGFDRPADVLRTASTSLERAISNFENQDVEALLADVRKTVSRNPFAFAGVMFGLGFAASRLLSASREPDPVTFNNSEPDWFVQNNPAPYARLENMPSSYDQGTTPGYHGGGQF